MKLKYRVTPGFSSPNPSNPGMTYFLESRKSGWPTRDWEYVMTFAGSGAKAKAHAEMKRLERGDDPRTEPTEHEAHR